MRLAVLGIEDAAAQGAVGVVGIGECLGLLAFVGQFVLLDAELLLPLTDLDLEVAPRFGEVLPLCGFGF